MKESQLQKDAVRWLRNTYPTLLFYYVPNERSIAAPFRSALRAMGLLPGVSDLVIARASQGYHGLYSEVKMPGKTQSNAQKIFQRRVEAEGYFYHVWSGLTCFQERVSNYLSSPFPDTDHKTS